MDCRYCHSFVDIAAQSNVPNTQACMKCHCRCRKDNPKLEMVRDSWKTGQPIEWIWSIARWITSISTTPPT